MNQYQPSSKLPKLLIKLRLITIRTKKGDLPLPGTANTEPISAKPLGAQAAGQLLFNFKPEKKEAFHFQV
jgi:hypothetical protein